MVHVPPSEDEGLSVLRPSSWVLIRDSAYLDSAFMGAEFGIHRLEFGSVNVSPKDASELGPPGTGFGPPVPELRPPGTGLGPPGPRLGPPGTGLGTASFWARPINLTKHRFDSVSGNTVQQQKRNDQGTEISNTHDALGCLQGVLEATGVCHALKDEGGFIRGSHVSRRGCRGGLRRNRVRGRPRWIRNAVWRKKSGLH